MKRLIPIIALIASMLPTAAPAQSVSVQPAATARVEVYAGQNPDTNETNLQARFDRLEIGTFMRDVISTFSITGAWSNLAPRAGSGLYVTINPYPNSSQLGAIYQVGKDDSSALPPPPGQSPNQIPRDNTNIVIQGTQNVPTAPLGPLSAPTGTGKAIYYLIEAQLSQIDTANQSMLFVSSSGVTSYQNVNTQRQDIITYQFNSNGGSAVANCTSTFPPPPTPDSGWVPVALVCVPQGQTQVVNSMIFPWTGTNFNGSSFGAIQVGGQAAQNGDFYPTTVTTNGNQSPCGLASAAGIAINNPGSTLNGSGAGVHLLVGDLNANISICGGQLIIYDSNAANSTPASIQVYTNVDKGSSTSYSCHSLPCIDTMYPAAGQVSVGIGATCTNGSWCTLTHFLICSNAGAPTAAILTLPGSLAGFAILQASYPTSGTGLNINLLNQSGSSLTTSSGPFPIGYVCF